MVLPPIATQSIPRTREAYGLRLGRRCCIGWQTDHVAELNKFRGELVGGLQCCRRVDSRARNDRVPIAFAIARRQLFGLEAELEHRVPVPAHFLQPDRDVTPCKALRDNVAVFARDPATDENVQEPQEMTFGLAVRFEFIQELPQGACIHSGPPASDWAFGAAVMIIQTEP